MKQGVIRSEVRKAKKGTNNVRLESLHENFAVTPSEMESHCLILNRGVVLSGTFFSENTLAALGIVSSGAKEEARRPVIRLFQ